MLTSNKIGKLKFIHFGNRVRNYLFLYDKTEGFHANKSLNAIPASSLQRNMFWLKHWQDAWKTGSQYSGDQGNIENVSYHKSEIFFSVILSIRGRVLSRNRIGPRGLTSDFRIFA